MFIDIPIPGGGFLIVIALFILLLVVLRFIPGE